MAALFFVYNLTTWGVFTYGGLETKGSRSEEVKGAR